VFSSRSCVRSKLADVSDTDNASRSARARVRAELSREILVAARRRLADEGPAQLSLRAVARDLGLAPSALYRYYESRDALLTALIIEAYRDVGSAAAAADATVAPGEVVARWMTTTGAVRDWGLAHPQEWALIYGSPVPGYRAPDDTIDAANQVTMALVRILVDAHAAGRLHPPSHPAVPADLAADLGRVREVMGDLPDAVAAVAVVAWGYVLGAVSLELFGHYDGAVEARDSMWETAMTVLVATLGLGQRPARARRGEGRTGR
jgi:AcrR family transcriptional regulator